MGTSVVRVKYSMSTGARTLLATAWSCPSTVSLRAPATQEAGPVLDTPFRQTPEVPNLDGTPLPPGSGLSAQDPMDAALPLAGIIDHRTTGTLP